MIKPGDFFLSQNKKSIINKLIMFFTKSKLTHCGFIFFKQNGNVSLIEAGKTVQVVPWERNYSKSSDESYIVYRINNAYFKKDTMKFALTSVWYNHTGKKYGYAQLIFHIWRWFNEIFKRDVRKKQNWFSGNYICSEILFLYLKEIQHKGVKNYLDQFDSNNINCQDILKLTELFPEVFSIVERRGL